MPYIVHEEIIIESPIEKVWKSVIDFKSYSDWNEFIPSIEGPLEVGAQLKVMIHAPQQKKMKFKPILKKVHDYELKWHGTLWNMGFLFAGTHSIKLISISPHQTRLIHSEVFSGMLVPLLWKQLKLSTSEGFKHYNEALKKYAESTSKNPS